MRDKISSSKRSTENLESINIEIFVYLICHFDRASERERRMIIHGSISLSLARSLFVLVFCFMRTCTDAFRNIISVAFFFAFFLSPPRIFFVSIRPPAAGTHTSILISTPEREENIENCNPSQSLKWHVSAFFSFSLFFFFLCCSLIVDKQKAKSERARRREKRNERKRKRERY